MREMDNIPFPPTKQVKVEYMWNDIKRRAHSYGFSASVPVPYPLKAFDLANKLAITGLQQDCGIRYVREAYCLWFIEGLEAGCEQNLDRCFKAIGVDLAHVLKEANSERCEELYLKQTESARNHKIFGSPSFVVGNELFWGDDRLEDAICFAKA